MTLNIELHLIDRQEGVEDGWRENFHTDTKQGGYKIPRGRRGGGGVHI